MCGLIELCDSRQNDEPEPLVIQILIGAKVKIQDDDIGRIEELKEEIKKAIDEHMYKFTGAGYHRTAMWPYLDKPDHEVTFSDEGSFEYEKGDQEACGTDA